MSGIPYEDDIVKTITPLGLSGTADYFIEMGVTMPKDVILHEMRDYMLNPYLHTISAKEHVISVLKQLKCSGCQLYVLTASPHDTLDSCLKRLGIYHLFDRVWSCDDFCTTKADPNIYKQVAQEIGQDVGNILFLDDNLDAVKTAKQAGMLTCGVYDNSSKDYTEQFKELADYYIYNFSELLSCT